MLSLRQALLWTEYLCLHLQIHMLKLLTTKVMVFEGGAFGRQLGSEEVMRVPMIGLVSLC